MRTRELDLMILMGPFQLTESQNHRMVGVRRDLWGPSSPTSQLNLLRVHSKSSSRSLMSKLNKTWPSTDPGEHH